MNQEFNQSDIEDSIERVFFQETRIEVAFNLESDLPIVLPTRIHKCNYDSNRMLIYQPRPEVLPSFKYETMDIATLIEKELSKVVRMGLRCRIGKFLNNYKLSETIRENFLLIDYFPPMRKINLRSTYRLRTSFRFSVEATLHADEISYLSGTQFTVQDMSVTGIGLMVPKVLDKKENPMLKIAVKEVLDVDLILNQAESEKPPLRLSARIEIARKSMSLNAKSGFIGGRFIDLGASEQEMLFQFIHAGQLHEIRRARST